MPQLFFDVGVDAIRRHGVDDSPFQALDDGAHAKAVAPEIEQYIDHELAGAVIGRLSTTVGLYHRNITRIEQMGGVAHAPLGEDRLVLQQPELIVIACVPVGGELAHPRINRLVGLATQPTNANRAAHRAMTTRVSAVSAS